MTKHNVCLRVHKPTDARETGRGTACAGHVHQLPVKRGSSWVVVLGGLAMMIT